MTEELEGIRMDLDINRLKISLQQHFTDGLVIIVGSGLSCAEGIPGMGKLSDYLRDKVPELLDAAGKDEWEAISALITEKGLEAALLEKRASAPIEAEIVKRTAELLASHERTVIEQVFGEGRVLRFTRLIKHLIKPDSGIPVVTTNYDRLLELASEEAGLGVECTFVGGFSGVFNERESRLSLCRDVQIKGNKAQLKYKSRVSLCKPHGSLDWYLRRGYPIKYGGEVALPRLMITPGTNKFRNGYESPFDKHRERANLAIDRASRLLLIGYGFNDDHLETHLSRRIEAGVPVLLITHSISDKAMEMMRKNVSAIVLCHGEQEGKVGTRVQYVGKDYFIPEKELWDLGKFIDEVF